MLYLYLNQYNMLFLSVNKQEYLHNKYINQLAQPSESCHISVLFSPL